MVHHHRQHDGAARPARRTHQAPARTLLQVDLGIVIRHSCCSTIAALHHRRKVGDGHREPKITILSPRPPLHVRPGTQPAANACSTSPLTPDLRGGFPARRAGSGPRGPGRPGEAASGRPVAQQADDTSHILVPSMPSTAQVSGKSPCSRFSLSTPAPGGCGRHRGLPRAARKNLKRPGSSTSMKPGGSPAWAPAGYRTAASQAAITAAALSSWLVPAQRRIGQPAAAAAASQKAHWPWSPAKPKSRR